MGETKKIGLRMAKANEQDFEAAYQFAELLDNLDRGWYPAREEDVDAPTSFDSSDRAHLEFLYERLLTIAQRGSLYRIVGGLSTLMNPVNEIVDPDNDCIALHPRFKASEPPEGFARGALWKDSDGFARVQGVVDVADVEWAVMRRWRVDDDPKHPRLRRPFLFTAKSMRKGEDGWKHVPEEPA